MIHDLEVLSYRIASGIDVTLERCRQRDGTSLWAIREMGHCYNKRGGWEYEPTPSSRTEEFVGRCRWDSAEEALKFWIESKGRSRFYRQTGN